MRKFARPAAARGGLSAAYLEADMDEEDDYGEDPGMNATERARQALTRPRRVDEAAEVRVQTSICLLPKLNDCDLLYSVAQMQSL